MISFYAEKFDEINKKILIDSDIIPELKTVEFQTENRFN